MMTSRITTGDANRNKLLRSKNTNRSTRIAANSSTNVSFHVDKFPRRSIALRQRQPTVSAMSNGARPDPLPGELVREAGFEPAAVG